MSFRYALAKYTTHPERYPDTVLYYDEQVSIIYDAFPKSCVHLLILPRDAELTKMTPIEAFDDAKRRDSMNDAINRATELVRDKFHKKWRSKSSNCDDDDDNDDEVSILVCCHAVPSLSNLHIHVMTTDFHSSRLKNKKHFNSFATSFAIKFEEFPLQKEDLRRDSRYAESLLKKNMEWMGESYGGSFKKLKSDIDAEFTKKWVARV
jgi:aprataxin